MPRQPLFKQYPQVNSVCCCGVFLNRDKIHLFLCLPERFNQAVLISKMDMKYTLLPVALPLKANTRRLPVALSRLCSNTKWLTTTGTKKRVLAALLNPGDVTEGWCVGQFDNTQ